MEYPRKGEATMSKMMLKGIFPPMVTPFTNDSKQEVDEQALRDIVRFLLDNGVQGIIPCGGCGEWLALSEDEQKRIVEVTVDEVNGRIPVVAGACSFSTKIAVRLAKNAKDVGADAVMVETPIPKGTQLPPPQEVYEHHSSIADEAGIPVMMYNGADVSPKIVEKLIENEKIVAIKNSTRNLQNIYDLIKICGSKVDYFQGYGDCFVPALLLGARGCITSHANTAPKKHVELYEAFLKGDMDEAWRLHQELMPLWLELGNNPAIVKEALRILGHSVGLSRMPGRKEGIYLSDGLKMKIKDTLSRIGLVNP